MSKTQTVAAMIILAVVLFFAGAMAVPRLFPHSGKRMTTVDKVIGSNLIVADIPGFDADGRPIMIRGLDCSDDARGASEVRRRLLGKRVELTNEHGQWKFVGISREPKAYILGVSIDGRDFAESLVGAGYCRSVGIGAQGGTGGRF